MTEERSRALAAAVTRAAGWLELRARTRAMATPLASGVEAAIIVAAGRGGRRCPVRRSAPRLGYRPPRGRAPDRRRGGRLLARPDRCRGGVGPDDGHGDSRRRRCTRTAPSRRTSSSPMATATTSRWWTAEAARDGADLTRAIRPLHAGRPWPVPDQSRRLTRADLDAWAALGLALTSADLVGLMRGVLSPLELRLADATEKNTLSYSTNGSTSHVVALGLVKQLGVKAKPTATGGPPATYTMTMSGQIDIGWAVVPVRPARIAGRQKSGIIARGPDVPTCATRPSGCRS